VNSGVILDRMLAANKGYLLAAEAVAQGISRQVLSNYVKRNHLERVARGVYAAVDAWPDDLYLIRLRNSGVIFSHETALYLHGLMEREPSVTTVTVKFGYNAVHLRERGIKVVTAIDDYFDVGKSVAETNYGNKVAVYDMERTICDIIRNKEKMDIQVFQTAMKEYMASPKKKLPILMMYASKFGIENFVRTYTEVML